MNRRRQHGHHDLADRADNADVAEAPRLDGHERDALPDDGNRYELIDGVLIASPAPQWRHQRASTRLSVLLAGAVPADLEVLAAPFDVTLSDDTVMEPGLLVAPVAALAQRGLDGAPLLAVEIASPSSRTIDRHVKKDRLRRAGCPHYWIVDPDEPSITAWALRETDGADGADNADDEPAYDLVGRAVGDEELALTEPFDVRIVPAHLV